MSNSKNILLGYSGHAYVVAEAALKTGITVDCYADKEEAVENPFRLDYIGYEGNESFEGWDKDFGFILGIGSNCIRAKLGQLLIDKKEQLITIKHPSAQISDYSSVGKGTFISAHATVNALAKIGKFVILNTNSIIEHECQIADGVHIAPGAVLAGNVSVGQASFIGANAVIKEGVTIGKNVIVGAGSTIINDISNGKKIVGNPGREI